ncbi:hypothetical protein R3W88_002507 [Solanum pinnatisectum]|uniref:Uncharacterized protein n=1 Tax=Solanum pinnatisectum TaxID=50273 RepID=A0AAV9MP36_9SOLN|nr:hypothetical protein R3W88_002507 [Solanum pinnatisectum]
MMIFGVALIIHEAGAADEECITVISVCASFVNYGTPDSILDASSCVAITTLINDLITSYNPNVIAIATLADFCSVFFFCFTIDPNTVCE